METRSVGSMKKLYITKCNDSMLWYNQLVGYNVEYLSEDKEYYWSRDQGGYKNIVYKHDAILINDEDEDVIESLIDEVNILKEQVKMLIARSEYLEKHHDLDSGYRRSPGLNPPWVVTATGTQI
jgi:hypothetical protein